jgi:hypothetical protein
MRRFCGCWRRRRASDLTVEVDTFNMSSPGCLFHPLIWTNHDGFHYLLLLKESVHLATIFRCRWMNTVLPGRTFVLKQIRQRQEIRSFVQLAPT